MTVDDGSGEVGQLAVGGARVCAQHLERAVLVDRVALHQDALGSLGQRPSPECAFEVVVFGEPAQDYVDRALPVLDVRVTDVGEHPTLRGLLYKGRIRRVEEDDHRAGGFVDDLVDQSERML